MARFPKNPKTRDARDENGLTDVLAPVGTWEDMPETEELSKNPGADIPREELD